MYSDCPEMKTFWYHGILYTPSLQELHGDKTEFDPNEDVNEVILQNCK
jgi:hypothetical protein